MNEKNKNSGFSLIELVVVLAIMGVVVLFSVEIYGNINSADVESAAENTNSMLSLLRTRSITKANDFIMKIEKNSEGEFIACLYENRKKTDASGKLVDNWEKTTDGFNLGNKVTITCVTKNGTKHNLTAKKSFKAACSKSNGSYKSLVCVDNSGTVVSGTADGDLINQIVFKKGKHSEKIKLIIPTGRHYVE